MTDFAPSDAAEARDVVAWAASASEGLEIAAGGSKRGLGRPPQAPHALDLSRLAGIVDYDPSELVLTARAATPLAQVDAELAGRQQMLAFEPPDWRGLLGTCGEPTLGGTIACNLAGPRRLRAGAARDHLLGFAAINGRGEAWKAGGRVVKNVTGYDMCKLQAGAFGTLSVLTELSVRVVPRPETACTVVLHGLSDADAIVVLSQAVNTPHEVSGAAHLPDTVAQRSGVAALAGGKGSATVLRLEGHAPSVAFRAAALEQLFRPGTRLDAAATAALWGEIASVSPLLEVAGRCAWRLCPTPSAAPLLVQAIRARLASPEAFYDWGGGLVWLSVAEPDAGAATVREAMREAGGHATLIVAPDALRAAVPVFEPEQPTLARLTERVKANFDPRGILNPGRMREGR